MEPDPSPFHAFEQSGWQQAADHYGDAFGPLTSQTIAPLLGALGVKPGTRLLDVASGPGYVAAAAADAGATAVGVDFSSEMVGLAARRYPGIRFQEGDAESLPFPDASFDAVAINFGVLHLARPDTALAEACRVLVAGGRCALTVWAKPDVSLGFGIVLGAIETHGRTDVPLPAGPPFFRFSDPEEAARSLTAAGFMEPRVEQIPLVWRLDSADALYSAFVQGAVRTAALLKAQTPEALAAIRRAIVEGVEVHRRGKIIELPMAAVLSSATKPANTEG
jgi:ubiquinone/menaquinone biosynthesis C-methylase UbiE